MKEPSRLIVSITLTALMHIGFIFYVGKSAAVAPSSHNAKAVHFNVITHTEKKQIVPPVKEVKLTAKEFVVKTQTLVKKSIKKIFIEKETHISKEIVQLKEKVIESKYSNGTKIETLPVDTPTELTANSHAQKKAVKNVSVARQVDKIIVQEARYKSLPPPPSYPRRARLRGQQGTALIHAQLNITGEVIKTRLIKSSGFSLLDKAAIKSVYHWDFMPGTTEQSNIKVWVEIPVEFILQPATVG